MSDYQLFRYFLRDEGCEAAFDEAFYHYNGGVTLDARLWEAGDAAYILGHAFEWSATPEGRDFWAELDRRWYRFISSMMLCREKPQSAAHPKK